MKKEDGEERVDFEYTGFGTIPKSITHVRLLNSNSGLTIVEVRDDAFKDCDRLTEVVFNEDLYKIGKSTFSGCSSLKSIVLPSTIIDIGHRAFYGCSCLMEVVLHEGIIQIGSKAFGHCSSLQSITLPSSLTVIDNCTFSNCINLEQVVLNEGLYKIGQSAFYDCSSLKSITIPSTVTKIGKSAFANCNRLTEIVLNDGLKKIGNFAFNECKSLQSITIPFTVIEIDQNAFYSCNRLREIEFHGVVQTIGAKAFAYCSALEKFTFPRLSTRLENIIRVGHWPEVEDKIDDIQYRGIVRRGSELSISAAVMNSPSALGSWNSFIKQGAVSVHELVAYYEIKGATSLFELALWKSKINQAGGDINRDALRIDVPGPVKDAILQYL